MVDPDHVAAALLVAAGTVFRGSIAATEVDCQVLFWLRWSAGRVAAATRGGRVAPQASGAAANDLTCATAMSRAICMGPTS